MTNTTSRRAILAGAAAMIPATGVAALPALAEPDPIFALIERHRAAYMRRLETGAVRSELTADEPGYDEAEAADEETWAANIEAGLALAHTQPTTMAGIFALLDYVHEFNMGGIALAADPDGWCSSPHNWPNVPAHPVAKSENLDPEDRHSYDEEAFPLYILRNVASALRTIAVQS